VIAGNLFTLNYLLEGINLSEPWTALADAKFAALKAGFLKHAENLRAISKPNEAQTEKTLIYPILELLGWTDVEVQQTLSTKGRKQVPDALLFADTQSRNRSVSEPDQWRRYQHGLAVLEAKRWERSLDRASKGDEGVPATQMLQYLSRVDVQTSGKVRLGILTNGRIWRLYWQGALSVAEDFFEVDLGKALQLPGCEIDLLDRADPRITSDHCLKLFILLFGKSAFLPLDGPLTFHDMSRESGKTWEEKVAKDLSRLVFGELFPKLVTAIAANDAKRPPVIERSYLAQVRQCTLVLLYRLLFVVYAEDRDLLPHNREPYKDFSLTAMRLDIAKRKADGKIFSETMVTYWPKLTAIFKAISEGDNTFGIPPYNGGLFANESASILADIQLPDAIITNVIYGLSHRVEDGEPRYINYRDLSVQQLGTVYENTLEYDLKVSDDGSVIPDADDSARHESGSYYTPDSLVMLVVEKAIGPLVGERLAAFRVEAEKLAHDSRSADARIALLTSVDPAKAILSLKICDPAMGSGHFLVNLVDWLADKVLVAMAEAEQAVTWADNAYQSPLATEISNIRHEIIRHASENKWPYVDEHLQDRHIIRRMVLKRCVYGVDKNPLAVELAKVALWLHTFTVGAPLSFLDHHLRCGDSLFGAWVRPAIDRLSEWGSPLLMDAPRKRAIGAAAGMQTIERLTDADIAEVYQSKNLFQGIESMTSELTGLLTLVHAIEWQQPSTKLHKATVQELTKGTFGDPVQVAKGEVSFVVPSPPVVTALEKEKRKLQKTASFNTYETAFTLETWLPDMKARFEVENFLHWQVAFPGIWRDWEASELNGGFDAVIGNPPYVRHELIKSIKPGLKRSYPKTYDGTADIYVYFCDQGLKLLKPGGRLSYVVTDKWLRAGYAMGMRGVFADETWVEFVADFGHAKRFFPDADVFPSVLVVRKPLPGATPTETQVCVISRDDVPEKALDEAVANATFVRPRTSLTHGSWVLETKPVMALFDKIFAAGPSLREYIGSSPLAGIKTGFNKAFVVDSVTRDALIAGDPACANTVQPFLRGQDVKRWLCNKSGLYMIAMKSSADHAWPWADRGDTAEQTFRATFPTLYAHFKRFEKELRRREDQGRYWWELRPSQNYRHFEGEYIAYQDIAYHSAFALSSSALPEMTAFCLPKADDHFLLAVLNSPLMWHLLSRITLHGKDEALRLKTDKMETIPISTPSEQTRATIYQITPRLRALSSRRIEVNAVIAGWLQHTLELKQDIWRSTDITMFDVDGFIATVANALPKKRKLTAAEIAELKREHAVTVEPARQARARIFALESKLSDLVNETYGLTLEEVQLMWRTAPPRMPFTPSGLSSEFSEATVDDSSEDDVES
jgi:hypothetical protein